MLQELMKDLLNGSDFGVTGQQQMMSCTSSEVDASIDDMLCMNQSLVVTNDHHIREDCIQIQLFFDQPTS